MIPERAVVSLAVTYDEGWKAYQDGKRVEITPDGLGFMVLHPGASAGDSTITLHYGPDAGNLACAAVSCSAWLAAIAALFRRRKSGAGNQVVASGVQ
jgi:uncharacterized membrane protein YfhO